MMEGIKTAECRSTLCVLKHSFSCGNKSGAGSKALGVFYTLLVSWHLNQLLADFCFSRPAFGVRMTGASPSIFKL